MWLKLRWARFFALAGWDWKLSPRPGFDFQVTFPCDHSECSGSHTLIVRIVDKHYDALARKHNETFKNTYSEPHPALFGDGPVNTYWVMSHGTGGGVETAEGWTKEVSANELWERAAHN